jgi:iron complex transport system ATP-binding protein
VDLNVTPGRVTAVVGANGAGKSTLLRVMCGELKPTLGWVELDGRALSHWPICDLARRRAVLPQDTQVAFSLPVLDVVLLGRMPHLKNGRETRADGDVALRALEHVGLAHLADRAYPSLSGGEKQRVQLARMLAQLSDDDPTGGRYLLLDEPLSAQDVGQQQRILSLVRSLADSGVGILVIIHDLNAAAAVADELIVLRRGRTLACGAPGAVLTEDLVETAFGLRCRVLPDPATGRPLIFAGAPQASGSFTPFLQPTGTS